MAKIMKKVLTAVLSLAMIACFVPQAGMQVYAEDSGTPAIQLVQNGTAPNIPGGQGGSTEGGVYFGNYKQSSNGNGGFRVEPVKWRVLANADGKLFLLSDRCLDSQIFGPNYPEMTWETSIVRAWLNGLITEGGIDFTDDNFIDGAFSDKEQDAIATTSVKDDHPNWSSSSNDTEDQLFLLSDGEVQNTAYGFIDDNAREAEATDYAASMSTFAHFWWLRSLDANWNNYYVFSTGFLGAGAQTNTYGVRPAFNLDLNSVLFASAAVGGKPYDVGKLTTVGKNTTGEWKLTLLDDGTITGLDGHKDFAVSKVTGAKNSVTVEYKKAKTGLDEYISAIITDKPITEEGAAIKYYGKIAEASGDDNAAGTVTINTADKLEAGDTLYVFNEQDNGDKMTDYASALQEVKLYQITFHPNNGNPTFTETVEAGGTIKTERVYWEGHDFLGWYTDEAFENPYDRHAEVNNSFDLYGKWRPNNFDINFVNEDGTELQSCKVAYGDTPSYTGQTPTKKDDAKYTYTFAGWTPEIKPVTGDATYKATYTAKKKPAQPQPKPDPKPTPQPKINKAAAKIALDAGTKAISSGNKVTASWGAVKGASSYVIYANYCDQKKLKKIKTVSGKTTSFDITKLNGKKFNPKKNLKFYVVAYKTVKGKKVKLAKSIMAHAPGSKNSKRTNVTGVKVKKASFTLKKGKTAKIKAKLVLQKKGKKPLKHCAKFRYASSNKKVAKVSKKGKITAVGKGKCTVYVYAVSGVSKKIKVTVK